MSKGDELWALREQMLKSLYDLGAIGEGCRADASKVGEKMEEGIKSSQEDRGAVIDLLNRERLVTRWPDGGYVLTPEGFHEARRVVESLTTRLP